jgi:hypothetical protein
MSKSGDPVIDRLNDLEARLAKLEGDATKSMIELVSPNGEHKIIMTATDQGAGIWLQHADIRESFVAIYNGFYEKGAVVAVTGKHNEGHPMKGHDVAIYSGDPSGGRFQISTDDGQVYPLSADAFIGKKKSDGTS